LVAFVEPEDGVLISPRKIVALEQMEALLKEKGLTLEDLMESGRDIRGEIIEEMYDLDSLK
jgi:hypothetical protein